MTKKKNPDLEFVVRVSSLPRVVACAASPVTIAEAHAIGVPRDIASVATRFGTAYHALNEMNARGETVTDAVISDLARRAGADPDELAWVWSRIDVLGIDRGSENFVEERLVCAVLDDDGRGVARITGQADLVRYWESDATVRIDDWKSGRADPEGYVAQVRGYAIIWARHLQAQGKPVEHAVASVWSARHGAPHVISIDSAAEIETEWAQLRDAVLEAERQFHKDPSDRSYLVGNKTCQFCAGRAICPAYLAQVQSAVAIAAAVEVDESPTKGGKAPSSVTLAKRRNALLRERLGELMEQDPRRLYTQVRLARTIGDLGMEAFRNHVKLFGSLDLGDEYELRVVDQNRRPAINLAHVRDAMRFYNCDDTVIEGVCAAIEERAPSRISMVKEALKSGDAVIDAEVEP